MTESNWPRVGRWAYSPREAAELLGISRGSIYNLHARGEIRFVKLGKRTLITVSEIRRIIGEAEAVAL